MPHTTTRHEEADMTPRHIGEWLLRRWPIAGGAFILAAFALGVALGNPGPGGSQEHSDPQVVIDHMEMIATPVIPYPTIDLTQNPIRVEQIRIPVTPEPTVAPYNPNAGSATKPEGKYLFLPLIGRYYSLPDDVELVETIDLGSCNPAAPVCPVTPLYVYQRGDARIEIDSIGRTYGNIPGGDTSKFPFFTGENRNRK